MCCIPAAPALENWIEFDPIQILMAQVHAANMNVEKTCRGKIFVERIMLLD